MKAWLRRWLGVDDGHGTLTLLDEGIVLGVPEQYDLRPAEFDQIREIVVDFLAAEGRTLVLPWPVDVIDLRGKP